MLKVLCIFGTRPEAVKMAPVVRELRRNAGRIDTRICVTAQHRQMLDQVMRLFEMRADHDLDIMQPNQTLSQVTATVLTRLDPVLAAERPDWVLVQGDTTTVMAAALAAFYRGIRVGHVEAGLRTGDKQQPFPEEVNRKIATAIADVHFAPTQISRANLLNEGIQDRHILVTGNTVIDALNWAVEMPYADEAVLAQVPTGRKIILVTAHRRENFGPPMEEICAAIRDLVQQDAGRIHVIFPVHLNPNVQEPVRRILGGLPGVSLTPPLDYLPLVNVLKRATLVLTDSGGIQEEAPSLGKPVLVLRDTTERPEAVQAGTVLLVGPHRARIVSEVRRLLDSPADYEKMARASNPYGDGRASERIVAALLGT